MSYISKTLSFIWAVAFWTFALLAFAWLWVSGTGRLRVQPREGISNSP